MRRVTVGVSLKAYFSRQRARAWFAEVAELMRMHDAVHDAVVDVFVIPTYLQIEDALTAFTGTGVAVGAQDVSPFEPGPYTGEITAAELAETGIARVEIGHAERRGLFNETDVVVQAKVAASLGHRLRPVLCVGETDRKDAATGAQATVAQLHAYLDGAPPGALVVAYEPVWAIGAPEPAPLDHITSVTRALRDALLADARRSNSLVIYGGSARPGLLTALTAGDVEAVDGLFLGRFAHDPGAFAAVVDEAAALAQRRSAVVPVLAERGGDRT
jgi:triosephosphate isomerase